MACNSFDFQESSCSQVDLGFDWFSIQLDYTDESGAAIDLTGYDLNMEIKDVKGGTVILTLATISSSILTGLNIPTPANGQVSPQILAADTNLFTAGAYPFEITITNTLGHTEIWFAGSIQFSGGEF